jgi:hypothetical protein
VGRRAVTVALNGLTHRRQRVWSRTIPIDARREPFYADIPKISCFRCAFNDLPLSVHFHLVAVAILGVVVPYDSGRDNGNPRGPKENQAAFGY